MKKITAMILFLAMTVSLFTGCNQKMSLETEPTQTDASAGKAGESGESEESSYIEFEEEPELHNLTIKGGETIEMDDVIKKLVDFDEKYGEIGNLTISSEVKHINPQTEKTKDIIEMYESCWLESLTLQTISLSPRAVYNLMKSVREVEVILEDVAQYDVGDGDEMRMFYREYFPNMTARNGMYIADGILFAYDGAEKDIVIPESVTAIAPYALGCLDENKIPKINSVTLSDSVIEIGRGAFEFQPIKKLELGNSVREIGPNAFYETELKRVSIPESVEVIGSGAFSLDEEFAKIKELRFKGSTKKYEEGICFSHKVTYYFDKGIEEAFTEIIDYDAETVKSKNPYHRVTLSWIPVNEADGYEVLLRGDGRYYEDGDTDKYAVKKTLTGKEKKVSLKVPAPKNSTRYDYLVGMEVKPFKYINGKKVYGRSAKDMAETGDEEG